MKPLRNNKTGDRIEHPVKRLYTLKDASIYLGIGLFGVRSLCWKGELPFIEARGKWLVDVRDLDAWIEVRKECRHPQATHSPHVTTYARETFENAHPLS